MRDWPSPVFTNPTGLSAGVVLRTDGVTVAHVRWVESKIAVCCVEQRVWYEVQSSSTALCNVRGEGSTRSLLVGLQSRPRRGGNGMLGDRVPYFVGSVDTVRPLS